MTWSPTREASQGQNQEDENSQEAIHFLQTQQEFKRHLCRISRVWINPSLWLLDSKNNHRFETRLSQADLQIKWHSELSIKILRPYKTQVFLKKDINDTNQLPVMDLRLILQSIKSHKLTSNWIELRVLYS